jgi:hypothetical protein
VHKFHNERGGAEEKKKNNNNNNKSDLRPLTLELGFQASLTW